MNTSEIRLNNWYRFKHDKREIQLWPESLLMSFDIWNHIAYDRIEPIPLTEEWLINLGFEKREEKYYFQRFVIEKGISRFFDNSYSFRITIDNQNSIHATSVKYVHQLQNLYFALTGSELEIKVHAL